MLSKLFTILKLTLHRTFLFKVKTVKGLGKRGNFPLRIIYMCNRTSNQLRERCTGENCTSASIFLNLNKF